MLRKLQYQHIFNDNYINLDQFYADQQQVRADFESVINSKDETEIEAMLEKYELFIEEKFEPYAALHESR